MTRSPTHRAPAGPAPGLLERAGGMLAGVAVGDALGMPTEFLTRETIAEWYGAITTLRTADPRHPHHALPAGSVTDDTDHTLLLADVVIEHGTVDTHTWAERLLAWGTSPRVVANRFVGPSTLKTLEALKAGAPLESVPRAGTSCGAAMRVAPLAIAFDDRARLEAEVVKSCSVSHFTRTAISGAMSMAFALSAALEADADIERVAAAAQEGALRGLDHGDWHWTPPIGRRVQRALTWARTLDREEVLANLFDLIGVDMYADQLVPAAIALAALANGDPNDAMTMAANLGGDSDTLASMTGSLCGALHGVDAIDAAWRAKVEGVNGIDTVAVAERLVTLRRQGRRA
jgi:ADP-ribosylglycohydrolase